MKNSPHRFSHDRKKALRKASKIVAHPSSKPSNPMIAFMRNRNPSDMLKPLNPKLSRQILDIYKKHLEHAKFEKGTHHPHKRTTPGQVLEEGPHIPHMKEKFQKNTESKTLEKSSALARKIMKIQNQHFRKAA